LEYPERGGRALRLQQHRSITNTARRATTPGHALLNYAYAVLSGETRIALLAMGLDPAQGFLHRDLDALVHDVMEPVRPLVDRWLLALLERQVFTPADFSEDRRGEVRLSYAIRNQVTAHADAFRSAVAPYVEAVAHVLDKDAPTPLTGRKRSRSSRRKSGKKAKWILPVTILERCAMCGEPVQDRLYCERCTPQQQAETLQKWIQAGSRARRTHGGVSGVKRGAANRAHLRANAMDNADALREVYDWSAIFEDIQEIPLRTLASETGLSLRYVSLIRRGLKTPHPRHWPKFAKLVEGNPID
jgi:hypothetical protein